ncbi:MAG: diadenylate cyclase CdaA [Clostridia bacterium]|nr:diadenylate cyclase CdaA [Clostridia bacterium]
MGAFFSDVWSFIVSTVSTISFFDILDIALVSVIVYVVVKFFRDTRAAFLFKGIALVLILFFLSSIFKLTATSFILESFLEFGALAIIIIFQPELRSALEKVGRNGLKKFPLLPFDEGSSHEDATTEMINNVCRAVAYFSATKTGALIVIERSIKLGDIISSGKSVPLDSDTTPELIMNIFFNKAPLHDGAMIIRHNRIVAAGCVLPLSESLLDKDLGTRHRAGVGISEVSDAVAVIVSEETGVISLAVEGKLTRRYTPDVLPQALSKLLIKEETARSKKDVLKGLLKGGKTKDE